MSFFTISAYSFSSTSINPKSYQSAKSYAIYRTKLAIQLKVADLFVQIRIFNFLLRNMT